ncbi:TetR family transcriptional regulator [Rhodococcus sp. D2-41]|nr:TetR family transcriptional regulator [Rhodococcus sp. D2-41]
MIDAAERIVAERGLAAMSLREVQSAAGQSNKSAAQYHFGSRDGLISAVVEARMGPIDRARRALLDRLDPAAAADPRQLIEALIRPLAAATLHHHGSCYARFLAQAMFDPTLTVIVREHLRAESFRDVYRRLTRGTGLPEAVAALRTWHVVALSVTSLATWEGLAAADALPFPDTALVVTDLVDSCVALLTTPTSLTDATLADRPLPYGFLTDPTAGDAR